MQKEPKKDSQQISHLFRFPENLQKYRTRIDIEVIKNAIENSQTGRI